MRLLSLILIIGPLVSVGPVQAQSSAPTTEPVFGIGDREFLYGGWNLAMPNACATRADSIARTFAWADDLGVKVFRLPFDYGWKPTDGYTYRDALLDAADASGRFRFFLCGINVADTASYGLEAKFYLVPDSVPFKQWPCKFLYLDGGTTATNSVENDDWRISAKERVYDRSLVSVNHTIADSIVLDWSPERTAWWSEINDGSRWCLVPVTEQLRQPGRMFGEFWSMHDKGKGKWRDTNFVVVTGHLDGDETPQSDPDSCVLWIDVSYDIGHGEPYWDTQAAATAIASDNLTFACTTLTVRAHDLARKGVESWDKYQTISLPFDATECGGTVAGPLDPRAGVSKRINLRVRYAGNATVALRSVAIRDHWANLVLSTGDSSAALRDTIQDRHWLHATWQPPLLPRTLRPSIIGLAADGEQSPIQAAATYGVNKWLQKPFLGVYGDPFNGGRPDTVGVWLEGLYREPTQHQLGNPDSLGRLTVFAPEVAHPQDRLDPWSPWQAFGSENDRGAIREHNGGRFLLPELVLDSAAIERFEREVQIAHLCQYLPDEPATFEFQTNVARLARLARDTKKRLIAIPFVSNNIWVHESRLGVPSDSPDSVGCDRILEGPELKALSGTSIALGATGLFWQILSHPMRFLEQDETTGLWHGQLLDYPICGGTTADTTQDVVTDLPILDKGGTVRFTMPGDFWTGWRERTTAVRHYGEWLKWVGPELMKLHWRDAYSIHAQRPIPYRSAILTICDLDSDWVTIHDTTMPRTLPPAEIITSVTAQNPVNGVLDDSGSTYVEMGLFDVKPGRRLVGGAWVSDPMRDTHHVFIVNRRVFAPSADIASGPRRDSMVALAGTRRINLKLNLMKHDEFTFCRVREIFQDPTPLPGSSVARGALDTIVPSDSVASIVLGPGTAALLRITYPDWDTNLIAGGLQFSNQRKIVWDPDQRRYHCVYVKTNDTSRFNKIGYRRSTIFNNYSGPIAWEPVEYLLSETGDINDSIVFNLHPSLTIRRTPTGATQRGTAVTVVRTGHRVPVPYPARQVLLRTVWSPDGLGPAVMDQIVDVVDSAYDGHPDNRWGTPVVSRLDGADVVAWSDSLVGVLAAARVLKNQMNLGWWKSPATYTDTLLVSGNILGWEQDGSHGRYPSVPTFAHVRSRDSNIAIVWEQPVAGMLDGVRRSDIYYSRLQHTKAGANDTLTVIDSSFAILNRQVGVNRNPSISQHQDAWRRVQDVVVWEIVVSPYAGWPSNDIVARKIFTETRTWGPNDQPDPIIPTPNLWSWTIYRRPRNGLDWLYPNVSSLTYRDSNGTRDAVSTIAHRWRSKPSMDEESIEMSYEWADLPFRPARHYRFTGQHPTNSESPGDQRTRHALLYEDHGDDTTRLRTSREFFFARARPVGYTAEGRMLSLRMTDSTACGFSFLMADPWNSSISSSASIAMIDRDTSLQIINSLPVAAGLLRTRTFDASDSTWLGLSLSATFDGDTTGYWGSSMTYVVELVDSTTNLRVHLLDSFRISTMNPSHLVNLVDSFDLISGRYFIRTTVDTVGVSVPAITKDSRYPIGEFRMDVLDTLPLFKVRRLAATTRGDLRVTAHPNPATAMTEARFSVPVAGRVRVIISGYDGTHATTVLDEWMEAGRYALEIDTRRLTQGVHVVQVYAGDATGIAKVVVTP